jgi:hypothetical protein
VVRLDENVRKIIRATAEAAENKVVDKAAGPVTKGKTAGAAHAMKTREMLKFHRVKRSPSIQAPGDYPSRARAMSRNKRRRMRDHHVE